MRDGTRHDTARTAWRLSIALALSLGLAACGTTVPLSAQTGQTVDGVSQPVQSGTGTGTATGGGTGGPVAPLGGSTSGQTSGSASGAGGAGGSSSSTSTSGSTNTPLPGAARGVPTSGPGWDAKNVYIGVPTADDFNTVVKQAGANFNNGDVHAEMNAVAADINRSGGVLGRKVVVVFHDSSTASYSSNPSTVAQAMCTYFTQDRPVAAVINGAPQLDAQPNFHSCLEQKKVTLLSLTNTVYSNADYTRLGPHLFSNASLSTDVLVPAMVSALKRQGFFSGWDTALGAPSATAPVKVGLLLPDDAAGRHVAGLMKAQLQRAGVAVGSEYYYPPTGSGNESQSEVLKFYSAKVTHVLDLPPVELEVALFQRQAENQHYRPRYGISSFDLPLTVEENSAVAPPAQQVGSMGVGWQPLNDTSAQKDVGLMPGGKRCFAAMKSGGQTFGPSSRRAAFGAAFICDALYLLRDAMVTAPGFTGADLLRAMPTVGPRFTPAGTFGSVLSGQDHGVPGYYRDLQYQSSCSCFSYLGGNRPFGR